MTALCSSRERQLTREAAQLLVQSLRTRRRLPSWVRELSPLIVVATPAWETGVLGERTGDLAALGTAARAHLEQRLREQGAALAERAGPSWQLVQVRQALPDGGALVLDAADDWLGNDRPLGVLVHLDRYAASGERCWRHTIAPCALVELVERICLVAEAGVGDLMAAVPAELA